ncbi:MAG: aspartate aminotransferase family protein [Bacteroidales bacterium]
MSEHQFSKQDRSLKQDRSRHLNELDKMHYLPTFKRFSPVFVRGQGCRLWDADGNEYLDAFAGIAVCSLGHAHPAVTTAIRRQAAELLHVSNFFATEAQVALAGRLVKASGLDHVFLSNSGTESFEGAVKLARKYAYAHNRGGGIISMQNSFHGRTMAAIASGKPEMQKGFGPMPEGFQQVPFNDIDAFKAIVSERIAAVVVEPVQGEGGIHPAEKAYLQELREICDAHNILLVFDEIQCGMGRTGYLFANELYQVQPDIMILAKALGNGVPVGAILNRKKVSEAIDFGDHGTTFGGNPLASTAALAVLDEMQKPGFLKGVREKGEALKNKLLELQKTVGCIKQVRGHGLMLGVEFNFETKPLVEKMLKKGVVVNATAGNVLRLVPPLIITENEMEELMEVLKISVAEIQQRS